jgi:hypothetical protein
MPPIIMTIEANAQRIEHALRGSNGTRGASNVLQEHQATSRPQDPVSLGGRRAVVGDRAKGEGDDHGVEARALQLELLGVADPQVYVPPELFGPSA